MHAHMPPSVREPKYPFWLAAGILLADLSAGIAERDTQQLHTPLSRC